VTLRVEPPFVRRAERNQYRASLIGFQRQRRILMAFEDNILADSRQDLRQLRTLAESYAIQQRAVELGYSLVDSARSTLLAPPDPTSARGAAGDVAAVLRDLVSADGVVRDRFVRLRRKRGEEKDRREHASVNMRTLATGSGGTGFRWLAVAVWGTVRR
jgi:hypothetical protein